MRTGNRLQSRVIRKFSFPKMHDTEKKMKNDRVEWGKDLKHHHCLSKEGTTAVGGFGYLSRQDGAKGRMLRKMRFPFISMSDTKIHLQLNVKTNALKEDLRKL